MSLARVIILLGLLASVALIVSHLLGLPSYPIRGWMFSPRIEKQAYFSISGQATDQDSWSSRWGQNRPVDGRAHAIWSEMEVLIQHETRSGLVAVSVTGDSEAEVDAFIQTLVSDVEKSYSTGDRLAAGRGYFQGESDGPATTVFWRQRYLWLLSVNAIVFLLLWISVCRRGIQVRDNIVGGNGG
jgi:hypothetical protein